MVRECDAERPSRASRPPGRRRIAATPNAPQQDRACRPFSAGYDIEARIHTVGGVHVDRARRTEHDGGTPAGSKGRVRGRVALVAVGFGLDDQSVAWAAALVNHAQLAPNQIGRH